MTEPHPLVTDSRGQLARLVERVDPAVFRELRAGDHGERPAAVLVLFSEARAQASGSVGLCVLLQVRAATLRQHAGQVSFPGGRAEPGDADAVQTALREAAEETGLDPSGVDVLATLPPVPLAVSDHLVTPVIGWWEHPIVLSAIDPAETTLVWQVPVAQLLDPASRFTAVIERRGSRYSGPAFDVDGVVVWGFTAILLDRLFDALGWTQPWDVTHERLIES
ncbi:hypothetical protein GCM10027414_04330 [Humibacter ginsengiterrae]